MGINDHITGFTRLFVFEVTLDSLYSLCSLCSAIVDSILWSLKKLMKTTNNLLFLAGTRYMARHVNISDVENLYL